jgi:hypothetical protein
MDKAVFVDRPTAERTTLKQVLERYLAEVTDPAKSRGRLNALGLSGSSGANLNSARMRSRT